MLQEGDIMAVTGRSGCGKTTLFNILSGICSPDSGEILMDGAPIVYPTTEIAYMMQSDLLFPHKKLIDNVCLPLIIRGMTKCEAYEKAKPYFSFFGIEGYENEYPRSLSGGMRQRAAFLRTCIVSPKLVLLDEPFSKLDDETKDDMLNWFLKLHRKMSFSCILISHNKYECERLTGKIFVLKDGVLIGDG